MVLRLKKENGISDWGTYEEIMKIVEEADIIEMDRGIYSHYAMYWLADEEGAGLCFHVYSDDDGKGKKGLQYLKEVISESKCRINNLEKEATLKGYIELPKGEQIAAAKEGLEKVREIDHYYDLLRSNCENQVTQWKYGASFSVQVEAATTATVEALKAAGLFSRGAYIAAGRKTLEGTDSIEAKLKM